MIRILFSLIAFSSIFFLNWWLFIIILIIGTFLFRKFYEGLFFAFIFDSIYALENPEHFYLKFWVTIIFVIALTVIERLKKYLRFYPGNV
ncbi:MAG TPA: hypothetical protein QGH03_00055 [Candidatus Paceibacterota bacterium]|nr:hypothetical protein [Parcubacteria group bacterium]HJN62618.1 hypothetical protein [Candidatus Paceibacterota bacterium]|tara:strand:- start:1221 stop:1490 length:270 start_codon:yes stop_codon:yes gene_type:complete